MYPGAGVSEALWSESLFAISDSKSMVPDSKCIVLDFDMDRFGFRWIVLDFSRRNNLSHMMKRPVAIRCCAPIGQRSAVEFRRRKTLHDIKHLKPLGLDKTIVAPNRHSFNDLSKAPPLQN